MGRLGRVVTIGVYGYDATTFFDALVNAKVDTFLDIRARRGVRGTQYAFANSQRLQDRLAALDIRYLHLKDLAPPAELRALQDADDRRKKLRKRERAVLADEYVRGYASHLRATFDPAEFRALLSAPTRVAALCCVEAAPAACHRSLVAAELERTLKVRVGHLMPWKS